MERQITIRNNESERKILIDIPSNVINIQLFNREEKLLKSEYVHGKSRAVIQFQNKGIYFLHFFYANEIFIQEINIASSL